MFERPTWGHCEFGHLAGLASCLAIIAAEFDFQGPIVLVPGTVGETWTFQVW